MIMPWWYDDNDDGNDDDNNHTSAEHLVKYEVFGTWTNKKARTYCNLQYKFGSKMAPGGPQNEI